MLSQLNELRVISGLCHLTAVLIILVFGLNLILFSTVVNTHRKDCQSLVIVLQAVCEQVVEWHVRNHSFL